jgi:hypothetical protein
LSSRAFKISDVVSDQSIRATVDGSFENEFVGWVAKLRTPSKVNFDRFRGACKGGQRELYILFCHPGREPLLRSEKDILVFEKQGCRHQGAENSLGHSAKKKVARPAPTAKAGNNY